MTAVGASSRLFELLDREPAAVQRAQVAPALRPTPLPASISLRDVHFTYPARPDTAVLKGVSFDVPAGTVVALVGASGWWRATCERG